MRNKWIIFPFTLLLFLFSMPAFAEEGDKRPERSLLLEIEKLEEECRALNLIFLLGLERDQVEIIKKQSRQARSAVAEYEACLPMVFEFQADALKAFKEESEEEYVSSPESESNAALARYLHKRLHKKMVKALNKATKPICGALSKDQARMLSLYKPTVFPIAASTFSQRSDGGWHAKNVREAMTKAADMPAADWREQKEALTGRIVNSLPRLSLKDGAVGKEEKAQMDRALSDAERYENREDAALKIGAFLEELRRRGLEERGEEIEHFIERTILPASLQRLEREMMAIEASKTPAFTPAARFLIKPDMASLLEKEEKEECRGYTEMDEWITEIRKLREEISLLNLTNGLNLTSTQIEVILEESRRVNGSLHPAIDGTGVGPDEWEELHCMLIKILAHLKEGRNVPEELKARYRELKKTRQREVPIWKLKSKEMQGVRACAQRVEGALLPAQRKILVEYEPCLIPPKDLKDPVRVGEADSTVLTEQLLAQWRKLPRELFQERLEKIIHTSLLRAEDEFGVLRKEDREEFISNVIEVCEQARAMSDVEFALNRQDLARALAPLDREGIFHDCLIKAGVPQYQVEGRIVSHLFDPLLIPLLERRLQRRSGYSKAHTMSEAQR